MMPRVPLRVYAVLVSIVGQVLLFGLAVRRAPRRTLIAAGMIYGSHAVWLREVLRDG